MSEAVSIAEFTGFLRLRCTSPECSDKAERIVPFSCKSRGLCPSCGQKRAILWAERMAQGMDQLVNNAINGISSEAGVMPPKGGFMQLSDEEVEQAVAYMVGESS